MKKICYCEECEKDKNINATSPRNKSTAHSEKVSFSKNNDLTDDKNVFEKLNFNQLDIIVKEAITYCSKDFHRVLNKM